MSCSNYRVEYWPSHAYRRQFDGGNVNVAEDHGGETYLLALHLGRCTRCAIRRGAPTRRTRSLTTVHRQELSIGVSLNLQGVCGWLFEDRSRAANKIGHGLFEVFNFGYVPVEE